MLNMFWATILYEYHVLYRCDPPCIPYLGIYLSDLTFIEEGTPNFTDNGLLNFAKMRMVRMAEPVKSCLYELYLKIVFWFRGSYCPHIAEGKTPITIPLATLLSDLTRAPNV